MGLFGAFLIVLFLPKLSNAQNSQQLIKDNKKLIQNGFDKWKNGTGSFFDLLDDNLQWTITGSAPLSKTYTSKKQFMEDVILPLNERLSEKIVPEVTGIYADGDMVIVLWKGKATATDGKPYNATYSWNMQLKEGKIINVIAFLDGIEFTDIMTRISIK